MKKAGKAKLGPRINCPRPLWGAACGRQVRIYPNWPGRGLATSERHGYRIGRIRAPAYQGCVYPRKGKK